MMRYGVSCLGADSISISFAHNLGRRDSQFKNIRRHFGQGDDPIGECFSRRFLRAEPVMQSIQKNSITFSLGGAWEGKWQQIGRASCRERVEVAVGAVSLKKKEGRKESQR